MIWRFPLKAADTQIVRSSALYLQGSLKLLMSFLGVVRLQSDN